MQHSEYEQAMETRIVVMSGWLLHIKQPPKRSSCGEITNGKHFPARVSMQQQKVVGNDRVGKRNREESKLQFANETKKREKVFMRLLQATTRVLL
ncbi:CLUMA_CG013021, isoform A [Clunio marinus]|uniref:CLUMA_CG013021, isoform A n=1 Tax=Clunio marinus TaxID=568069 RepID=A0A1J1IIS8_9DIPT|nr:CLUMA_CG013021, isoform A [Clunio marinus]